MEFEHEIYTIDVVFRGNFNPVIINPSWLALKKIIRESDATAARVEVIHPEISKFDLEWCDIQVTNDRIDFKSKRESEFGALRDLIVSIFTILGETPITAIGINHLCHYSLKDVEQYKNLGFWLSAVQEFSDFLESPRLLSIQITETQKENNDNGLFRIIISPSDLIHDNKSIVINTNHHFQNLGKVNVREYMNEFVNVWRKSFERTKEINHEIWKKARL